MRTVWNLEMHELIGLECEVADSTNPLQKGISGIIVDETYHTLVIRTHKGDKRIQKRGAKFKIKVDDRTKMVYGSKIEYRPHERTKKLVWRRKRW
ncbi:MAG: ribonuclease P protein subunit [Euryarchaeota archaeon]|nr:ribonuclease P protein subunit [Euryarchaeota archaeon]